MDESKSNDGHGCLYWFLFGLIVLTMFVNHYQAAAIRNLQHRIAVLEQRGRWAMGEQDVHNHDAADVLVSYDPERNEIRYTAISTGEVLLIHNCSEPHSAMEN